MPQNVTVPSLKPSARYPIIKGYGTVAITVNALAAGAEVAETSTTLIGGAMAAGDFILVAPSEALADDLVMSASVESSSAVKVTVTNTHSASARTMNSGNAMTWKFIVFDDTAGT
jgi:hypothetical protein